MTAKVALVTASSAGLGAVCVKTLATDFRVVVNFHSRPEKAEETIKAAAAVKSSYSLAPHELRFHAVQGDVSKRSDLERMVQETVDKMGRLDVVVSNGGWTRMTDFFTLEQQMVEEDWDRCFNINVKAHLWLLCAAKPHLETNEGAGSFITVASIAGIRPGGSSLPYAVTKAAEIHLTKCLAVICGKTVRCNSVSPGLMMTEWGQRFSEQKINSTISQTALKALPRVEDIAEQVKTLALNQSITGQNIVMDCGIVI